ncbi:nitrite reductase [Nocardioides marinisabuli]|uniref:nitrite reductase n=1 Tax=Nocardioides marinisabuli TaxID=419476 RepID=UPI0015CE5952|nr:nitrite reductase [Nocardioides marinisabuli]
MVDVAVPQTHSPASPRSRADRCPGVSRPWPADDGALVRVRLVGGRVPAAALRALSRVAQEHGDGRLHLTGRANLQLRALPSYDVGARPALLPEVVHAIRATGLLPAPAHDLVRNIVVSPQTGLAGGRADLRPVAARLDTLLCADPALAALPGRFLHVLDDGRGDVAGRGCDLGLVALDDRTAQLRVGDAWGEVLPLDDAPARLVDLARAFLATRGSGPQAAWHVSELARPLAPPSPPDERALVRSAPPAYGVVAGGWHQEAVDGVLGAADVDALVERAGGPDCELVITPWRGVLVPEVAR